MVTKGERSVDGKSTKWDLNRIKVYFNRLIVGTITFDAIPEKYQDKVREYGIEYVKKDKISVEEYEMLYKEEYPEDK